MSKNNDELRKKLAEASAPGATQKSAMTIREAKVFKITAGELRAACKTCSGHPQAAQFEKSVEGWPDAKAAYVESLDLEAMLDGKKCEWYEETETTKAGTRVVTRKRLVPMDDSTVVPTPVKNDPPAKDLKKP